MLKKLLSDLKMKGALEIVNSMCPVPGDDKFAISLLQGECEFRIQKALAKRMNNAKFPIDREWSELDHALNPTIDFTSVEALGNGEFILNRENLCLMGTPGTGKTHSLIALSRQLCRQGFSVGFYTAYALMTALEEAKEQHKLGKFMDSLLKPQLLVIDELGFVPFSAAGASLLFEVFAKRHERGSIAVSTNLSFDKWVQVFGSIELTAALIDRFAQAAKVFLYKGKSIRWHYAKCRNKQEGSEEQKEDK
jgi:DNA replication protein DnaC